MGLEKRASTYFPTPVQPPTYSLFHQILGVAFFQFAGSLFEIFKQNFSRSIFSSSPNIAENFVEFCCVFCKLDHLACTVVEFLFHGNDVEERCDVENLLHAKWSNFDNTTKKSTKFSGMLAEDEKMI